MYQYHCDPRRFINVWPNLKWPPILLRYHSNTVCRFRNNPLQSTYLFIFQESVDVKRIAQMRPFADLLMIETCTGSLSFLGNYRISLKELEVIVHKVIVKLETPRPLEKPTSLPQPSPYEKAKYKIKDFKLQLKDIKNEQKCGAALKVYKAEKDNRIRKKKRKLLQSLRDIGKTILI